MADVASVNNAIEIIPDLPDALANNNDFSSPIVIKHLSGKIDENGDPTFLGTAISGSLKCTDTRDDSHMIFITAMRPGDVSEPTHYYAGYGMALRMLTSEGISDQRLSLFVVDNSLASRTVVAEDKLHTGWGDYGFLQAMHYPFSPNTQYNYRLKFLANGGLEFYIWNPASSSMPGTPTIAQGAYAPQSAGEYWGISCSNTGGYQTIIPSISLSNTEASYALLYCSLNASGMGSTFSAVANAWAGESDLTDKGITMHVYKHSASGWDPVTASHNFGAGSSPSIRLELEGLTQGDHADPANGFVDILLISQHASDFNSAIDVLLYVDNPYLESYSTDVAHQGGCTDAWVHDSNGLSYQTIDIMSILGTEWLISSNASITTPLILPCMFIKEIVTIDGAGNELATLTPITDWTFHVFKEDYRYSDLEENYIIFRAGLIGSNVRVKYYTSADIETANAMVRSQLNSPSAYDILVKAMVPNEVFITADVVASLTPAEIMQHIYDYIRSEHRTSISYTDINIYLQAIEGIDDANVTNMYSYRHDIDGDVATITAVSGTLSLGNATIDQFVTYNDTIHMTITVS